ncbi:outer dense fiber protein 3 isoform X4 [Agrilus planipennis]|uniref:Outer dense fiber protein 3 isoform X4 n=1 Tax=Agrilus planipennis TaxID=224129 RepID=A0A1W4XWC0_AGRPL|nr:outer dense fiber protein 3 isoform X4 [Agrilus planipennis]
MGGFQQRPWTPTKRRGPIAAEFASPGPASVSLPSTIGTRPLDSKTGRAPAFSFGNRHNDKTETIGPGPGQYNVTGLSAKGKDTPKAASLHGRPKDCKGDNTPAPGDYNPDKAEKVIHDNAPKYTFGLKTNREKPLDTPAPNSYNVNGLQKSPMFSFGSRNSIDKIPNTPAPNVYNIPNTLGDKKSAPAYTISGRNKDLVDERVKNPGPGSYNNVDPITYKEHAPSYTISGRTNIPCDHLNVPGPGVYSPEKVEVHLRHAPAYSFGIRHSPFLGSAIGHSTGSLVWDQAFSLR